jgi:hypothetical protein
MLEKLAPHGLGVEDRSTRGIDISVNGKCLSCLAVLDKRTGRTPTCYESRFDALPKRNVLRARQSRECITADKRHLREVNDQPVEITGGENSLDLVIEVAYLGNVEPTRY